MKGRVVLISGGASGIGRAVGAEVARRGADVVLADRQHDLAEEAAESIRAQGGRAEAASLDVRDLASWQGVVDALLARTGRIDFLFNNAGIAVGGLAEAYDQPDWDDVVNVNLLGVGYGIQAVYSHMIRQGHGHIVNTSSMLGLLALPGNLSYVATKHAVVGLSKALRVEAAAHGVRVSVLCPGAIRTPILRGGVYGRIRGDIPEPMLDRYWESVKPITAEEFARRVVPRVLANEAVILEPRWWRFVWYLDRLLPVLTAKLSARNHRKFTAAIERFRRRAAEGPAVAP